MKLVRPAELARLITAGEFVSQLHIGTLMLAELHGFCACRAWTRRGRRAAPPG